MILTLNTAAEPYFIALYQKNVLLKYISPINHRNLAENLLDTIETALLPHGGLEALTGLAMCKGPGRYISLRIAATTLRTLAQVLTIPIKGFCTLEVLAQEGMSSDTLIISILPSYKNHYHLRLFGKTKLGMEAKTPLMHLERESLERFVSNFKEKIYILSPGEENLRLSNQAEYIKTNLKSEAIKNLFDNDDLNATWQNFSLCYQAS